MDQPEAWCWVGILAHPLAVWPHEAVAATSASRQKAQGCWLLGAEAPRLLQFTGGWTDGKGWQPLEGTRGCGGGGDGRAGAGVSWARARSLWAFCPLIVASPTYGCTVGTGDAGCGVRGGVGEPSQDGGWRQVSAGPQQGGAQGVGTRCQLPRGPPALPEPTWPPRLSA